MELIGYLSNAYPSFEESYNMAKLYHEGGMDTVQIDFPASDPYLEGEHIAKRMMHALKYCRDWNAYMENISEINRNIPDLKIILLVYDYTVKEIGTERFIRFCRTENLLDITYIGEEHPEVKAALMKAGLRISSYVQFHLDPREVENACNSNGFVYLQARPQVPNDVLPFETLAECIHYLRQRIDPARKIYTGVGLRTTEDVLMAKHAGSDGVFVGSSIMEHENNHRHLFHTIKNFKNACSGELIK